MQQFDTRKTVDCKFFLFGTCTKGPACPFRHDPTMITVARTQQAQQDCIYFLQGRCSKGSLCPFKHGQAKLPLALQGLGGLPGVATAPVNAAGAGPGRAAQQPITVDFGASGSPEGIPGPTVDAAPSNRGASSAQQPVAPGLPRQVGVPAANAQRAQQQQQPVARAAPQQQPMARSAPQQQPQRSQPDQGATGRSSVFSRLAGRLGPTVASDSDRERQSPPKARPTRQVGAKGSDLAEAQLVAERAVRQPVRRGGGALGVALSALQSVVRREASGEFAEDSKLQRTILLEQPSRKRRLGSEEQSVKFVEDEVPAIAVSSPPRGKKPAVTARLRPAPAAAVPAAAAAPSSAQMQAVPRLPQPAAEGSGKQEQAAEFRPPKSLHELRKERQQQQQQRSSGSQEKPAQAANSQRAVHSKPKKHKPIQWQPESAQPMSASQAAADERHNEAAPPAAAPSAVVPSTEAAAAPAKTSSQEQQPTAAPAALAAAPAPAAAEPAGKSEEERGGEDMGMDTEDEEFDIGEGDGGDEDIDDFEAQMRALEEQL